MGNRGVKDEKISWKHIAAAGGIGILLFYGNGWLLGMNVATTLRAALYTATLLAGFLGMLAAGLWSSRLLKNRMTDDPFNAENESFMQETRLLKNDDSFNFPTEFVFRRRRHSGWINVVNPFRASIVLGTPGSGKSYALINNYIKQAIEKGYALYVYDFKFDDLSVIAYNHLRKNLKAYGATPPRFYVINFDDPRRSHRCNPLAPNLMSDITDAYEASYVIMLNLNRSWIQKQGDFFVESPIVLLAAIIWFLKIYDGGKYCTFPHAIELLNKPYEESVHRIDGSRGVGELSFALRGCMERWSRRAADGADRLCEDSPLAHDLTAALLGHVGRRFYTRHQQPRGTEDSLRGKQSRQAEHIRRGARIV